MKGGPGAVVTADIPVVPGTTLYVVVGGNGVHPVLGFPAGGFNGGGRGGAEGSQGPGGRGGGASDVQTCTRGGGGFFGGGGGGSGNGRINGGGILSGGGGGGSSYVVPSATGVSYGNDTTGTPSVTITYTPESTGPSGPAVVQGSIWYSDGTKSAAGPVGTGISAYAVNTAQDVPYKLVLGTGAPDRACQTIVQVLNPTPVFRRSQRDHWPGDGDSAARGRARSYKLCFEDSSTGNLTGTGGGAFTVTG